MNVVRGYGREASADAPVVILFLFIWFGNIFLSGSDIFFIWRGYIFYLAWIYFLSGLDIFSIWLGYFLKPCHCDQFAECPLFRIPPYG